MLQNDGNQRQKRFDNKQQRKLHQSQEEGLSFLDENTDGHSLSRPPPTHRKIKADAEVVTATHDRQGWKAFSMSHHRKSITTG